MYYYIFESPKSSQERQLFEKIRDMAREFGIAGEITQSSPARTPEELAMMGVEKSYSTIVAIGSDTHINKIISKIISTNPNYPFALGIIPTDSESSLARRWHYKSVEEACETLKYRRVQRFNLGYLESNKYFLTSAFIYSKNPVKFHIETEKWNAYMDANLIQVFSDLTFKVERIEMEKSKFKSTYNWLMGKQSEKVDRSIFKARTLKISGEKVCPVYVGNEIVAKTPTGFYRKLKVLNIITKRDNLIVDTVRENKGS